MSPTSLKTGYYSVRRLSPFQGVLQITEIAKTRALSADGIHWQIQIRHDMPKPRWGSLDNVVLTRRYLRYGVWNRRDGLSRLPIPPTVVLNVAQKKASALLDALEAMPSDTHFPLGDLNELWLLDANHRLPLALLASALSRDRRRPIRTAEWIGVSAQDRRIAASGAAESLAQDLRGTVERLIKSASGTQSQAQWFERTPSGAAIGLEGVHLDPTLRDRRLPASVFPELPLRADWPEQSHVQTVRDFHSWQAPALLTLPNISDKTRRRLENFAGRRPLAVYSMYRLYPKIIQKELITKALVEAKIRIANASSDTDKVI